MIWIQENATKLTFVQHESLSSEHKTRLGKAKTLIEKNYCTISEKWEGPSGINPPHWKISSPKSVWVQRKIQCVTIQKMQCSLSQDVTILLPSTRRAHFILQAPILSPKCIVKQNFLFYCCILTAFGTGRICMQPTLQKTTTLKMIPLGFSQVKIITYCMEENNFEYYSCKRSYLY